MRQKPVSCHFCRSRKLRCSRESPCTNCAARGVTCGLYPSAHPVVLSRSSKIGKKDASTGMENSSEILERLRRLEELVLKQNNSSPASEIHPFRQDLLTPPTINEPERLELECMNQDAEKSIYPDKIVFKPCPIREISRSSSYIYLNSTNHASVGNYTKCIRVPLYEESKILLEKYLKDITYTHHVIHLPSMRLLLDELYRSLEEEKNIQTGQVVLLLGILASTTYSWTVRDMGNIFSSVEEVQGQSSSWIKATMDILNYSHRTTSGSIEDIQAMIIVSFVICNLEGMSSRYRNLIANAISLGRELMIHRIDHPWNSPVSMKFRPDSVRAEIARRVWWYLAATDWMLSRYAGPQEGVYTIDPRHMYVNKPLNTNDEDLFDGMITTDVDLPLSHPTSMSYFLQRIRLAEISREFTDRVPLCLSSPDTAAHGQVMEVDTKFDIFVKEIPAFFCLDGGSLEDLAERDARRAPGIIIQRYILHSLVYAHRCKLHLRYMARGPVDTTYARSREICLQAARMVIRTERLLEMVDLPFVLARLRFSGVLYSIIMAIIVLLMDLCFHRSQIDESVRKAEVLDACSILGAAREQSPLAGKLFEPLRRFLEMQRVSVPGLNAQDVGEKQVLLDESSFAPTLTNVEESGSTEMMGQIFNEGTNNFEEIWQLFNNGTDMENLDWNGLFSELTG